ncbi:hypothetical protein GGP41_005972 [Bipolaris sorokiniana]|uniref:Uncharacterized protein n=1 Tax=Cochliobolus sativus TaxID=45130 RepID=A0A8H5ZH03_COCSA|nr:hypothetical protein GGP41_005972 [Bipolaris sorokiniana]
MALEDAVTVAECLECAHSMNDTPDVLDAFQEIRPPRCRRVPEWSAIKGRQATLPNGPEQEERDSKLRSSNAWVQAESWDKHHIDEVPKHETLNWKA